MGRLKSLSIYCGLGKGFRTFHLRNDDSPFEILDKFYLRMDGMGWIHEMDDGVLKVSFNFLHTLFEIFDIFDMF